VSVPRISVFARLANGDMGPIRFIGGQATKLSRTMHGIAYDAVHDEIIVPVALAGAILVFRGGASGDEPPIQVIQGPHTQLDRPHTVAVDPLHGEIMVGDRSGRGVLVFPLRANGDVAPIRTISGDKTGLVDITGVGVDPIHNLIVVSSSSEIEGGKTGLFIFNRMANGNVTPKAVIAGPKTGIIRPWQLAIDSAQGKIFAALVNNLYFAPYTLAKPRTGLNPNVQIPMGWAENNGGPGFIGVWKITDNGDVPPRAVIKGMATYLVHPAGVAIDPSEGEVFATDSVRNGLFTFRVPQFFKPFTQILDAPH
ncbi:MAG: hypothetical protein ACRD10_07885, partial [Terriglobia bacterium]